MVNKLDPRLTRPIRPKDGTAGVERPQLLVERISEEAEPLVELGNRHVVSAHQFDRPALRQLFRLAGRFETTPTLLQQPLDGKILISAFYEPSTRTRLSFESAWHRLGGDIMSITDRQSTGIAKGESLFDVGEMFNNYGDVLVLRDSSEEAVYEMLDSLRIPIINAGNGIDEHPTQALADIYAIAKKWPGVFLEEEGAERIRIGIIGTPNRMRTIRSLLTLMALFHGGIEEVVIINKGDDVFDPDQREALEGAGLSLRVTDSFDKELPGLDVVYINSIAWVGDRYEKLAEDIRLSAESPLKEDAIILHPLARGEELATDLDNTPHNWYFAQARGAVFVRMALLTCLVQRVGQVMDAPEQSFL